VVPHLPRRKRLAFRARNARHRGANIVIHSAANFGMQLHEKF
jgi:hypothetical protein